ncbi:MAG: hypothetical protein L0I84_06940 [Halomonas subglaciescola]|nr:hypothetical protein [Halomonas subglaciescola]
MTDANTIPITNGKVLQGAVLNGVINAVINGAIQVYFLWGSTTIPLSVDEITNDSHTVLGSAVPLAVSLAMILTVVAYMTLKAPKKPFWPSALWLTFKHGMFAFGLCVTGAVMWQSAFGTVAVSLTTAVIVLGAIAGLVAGVVNYMTIRVSLLAESH